MRIGEKGEFALIADLRRMLAGERDGLVCGIGDDTAVIRSRAGTLWAFTADAMVESVHFDPAYTSWHSLGFKSLAVNISDLAAMGGQAPSYALVVLGLTSETEVEAVEEIYRGMEGCGSSYGCSIAGGDIVRSPQHLFISVSVVGPIYGEEFLTRSGAYPRQLVMVTGTLGDSCLGLRWLTGGGDDSNLCARRHLYPQPRLAEGARALELGATACIDVSDGLLKDLGHICEESGVGAEVYADRLPISAAARETARELAEDALAAALFGGEDYELVIVAEADGNPAVWEGLGLTVIGRITEEKGVAVLDSCGERVEVDRAGYEHFKEG